jgi:AraC family transcriptional regulator
MLTHESPLTSSIEPALAAMHLRTVTDAALAQVDRLRARPQRRDLGLAPHALRRALSYVDDNLDGSLTWEDIAAALGMNHFTLGRAFRASTGMTLHQYVTERRVHRARQLLEQGAASIADVALEVGFSCQSHLTTQFRKHTGTTPAAFRRAATRGVQSHAAIPLAAARSLCGGQPAPRVSIGSTGGAAAIAA